MSALDDITATPPRNLDIILDEVAGFVRRYVVLTEQQSDAVALWIAHAHLIGSFDVSPPLAVVSPEKRSGKTRLLDVLELLVPRPWRAISPSEAVVYRFISANHPTLLLDEVDAIFGRARENTEGLRALLNAGNQRGTRVPRCVGTSLEIVEFSVFGAKVLAGIGELPDTVSDRAIIITMRRRTRTEPVKRFRRRDAGPDAVSLRDELTEYAQQAQDAVYQALDAVAYLADDGEPLEGLDDRRFEQAWEPLLAVARIAGASWLARAVNAAIVLSDVETEPESLGVRLLADTRAIFDRLGDRVTSQKLADELADDESSPWADWYGHRVTPRATAKILAPFGIRPKVIKLGDGTTARGYLREAFEDAWRRYTPSADVTTVTTASTSHLRAISDRNHNGRVTDGTEAANPHGQAEVTDVTSTGAETEGVAS